MSSRLFEIFGEIGVKGADAAEAAIDGVEDSAESLGDAMIGAGERVEAFGDSVADVGATLSTSLTPAIGAATAALGLFARGKANAADETAKAAREAGVSAQSYQELGFAIGQVTNLSEGEFRRVLERTNQTLAEAAQGSTRYTDALLNLGFSQQEVADGSLDTERVVRRTFEAIREAGTQAEATGLAMDVFGRRVGRRLAPQIREANADLDELIEKFRDDELGMSDELLAAGERFNDMMDVQRRRFSAVGNTLAESLLPALEELLPVLVDRLIPILQTGAEFLATMANAFAALPEPIQTGIVAMLAIAAAAGPVLFIFGKLIGVFGKLIGTIGGVMKAVQGAGGVFAALKTGILIPFIPILVKVAAVAAALWVAFRLGKPLIEMLIDLFGKIGGALQALVPDLETIREAFSTAWNWIKEQVSQIVEAIVENTAGRLQSMRETIVGILQSIREGFANAIQAIYDNTIGRVSAMVDRVIALARRMRDALTGNSIIPDMAAEAAAEFEGMADSAGREGERMSAGLEGAARQTDPGAVESGRQRSGRGDGGQTIVDMSHSVFRDDRDMLDRMQRKGAEMTGSFA